jgi:hypothetical protein
MLSHGLGLVLQYVVKTDFELWRKPVMMVKKSARTTGGDSKRADGAKIVLEAVRNLSSRGPKIDEVNFKSTRIAVQIYEHVMEHSIAEIAEIVSSGLITGMLFRVGRGQNIDPKFNGLVVHFVREILVIVSIADSREHMALVSASAVESPQAGGDHKGAKRRTHGKKRKYCRGDEVVKAISDGNVVEVSTLDDGPHGTDIRSISTTLHSQGVTRLFLNCIVNGDDVDLVSAALSGLSLLHFQSILNDVAKEDVMGKICFYCLTRYDCFFPGLTLVCEVRALLTLGLHLI